MWLAWRRSRGLAGALGGGSFGVRNLVRGEDDGILIRADKGANATGAKWILGAGASEEALLDAAARGTLDVLLVLMATEALAMSAKAVSSDAVPLRPAGSSL